MRYLTSRLLVLASLAFNLGSLLATEVGDVHGPICSWHMDPTSTMTIQWIERVNISLPQKRWYDAIAGFGYGDNDDETNLDMQDKYKRLFIRKKFEVKDELPKVAEVDVSGKWNATVSHKAIFMPLKVVLEYKEEKLLGTIQQGEMTPKPIIGGYVSGHRVFIETEVNYLGTKAFVTVSGSEKDGKIQGEWISYNNSTERKEWVKGNVVMERNVTVEEKQVLAEKTDEQKKKEQEPRAKVFNPDAFEMQLRIRYDDAFIAYLNGVEIVRANVKEGSGKDAKGIVGHNAEKEETFVIPKEFNRLVKTGENILAIEGHNDKMDSSDLTLDPKFYIKVEKTEHKFIDGKATWQFFLGDPAASWKTAEIKSRELPMMPEELTKFELRYGKRDAAATIKSVVPEALPFADTRQVIHRVILKGLQSDTGYGFTIHRNGSKDRLKNRKYFFKTAPKTMGGEVVSFVTGGDMYKKREVLDEMNRQCGSQNPLFALLGGDLAYANGKDSERWYDWVDSWHDWCTVAADYMVPMVLVIGNHECDKNIDGTSGDELKNFEPKKRAKFFYSLFPMPNDGKSNYALDFGDYMSIICLDSNHTQKPEDQVGWLKSALKARQKVPNLFACYHRPTYGTLVKDDEAEVRKYFVPLMEQYGVDAAFENDHHMYKRTMPIKNGEVDPDGVIYMGDGAWGVDLRDVPWDKTNKLEYIARAAKQNHLIRVQLHKNRQQFDAINGKGVRIDSYARFR